MRLTDLLPLLFRLEVTVCEFHTFVHRWAGLFRAVPDRSPQSVTDLCPIVTDQCPFHH